LDNINPVNTEVTVYLIGGSDLFGKVGCPSAGGRCEVEGEGSVLLLSEGLEVQPPRKFLKLMLVQMRFLAHFYAYVNI